MFGFFKAKPPLAPLEKAWTENRMIWLANQFGMARLLETPTLVPDYEGIPSVSNYEEALGLLDFLRTWMKIDSPNVRLQVHSDIVSPDLITKPDDKVNPTIINVREEDFEHRDTLVASMCRGLAHEAIVELGRDREIGSDNGWTAELLPAFLGLGPFAANATIKATNFTQGETTSWSVTRRGSLPSRVFGYAMALRTCARGDETYDWVSLLRQDAQVAFLDGVKYIDKTSDTIFTREQSQNPRDRLAIETFYDELKSGTPSRKILAMWELTKRTDGEQMTPNSRASDLLMDCIRHKEADVRSVAVSTLPNFDRSQHAAQDIADTLNDSNADVRAAAATALGNFVGVDNDTLVHDLIDALKDDADQVVFSAVGALSQYGAAAEPATKMLLKRLRRALIDCSDSVAVLFTSALISIATDPEDALKLHFAESDQEYLEHALGIYEQLVNPSADATA